MPKQNPTKRNPIADKTSPKTICYIRVSSELQDTEKNKADVLTFANERQFGHVQFVEEKVSGKVHWSKRAIKGIIDNLNDGDRLIVPELSRLGRSMLEIMEMLSIVKSKNVNVYAIKGGWELNGSIQSKVMAMAFSIAAEIERNLISERTTEALRARKAAGVKLGRPKGPGKSKLAQHQDEFLALMITGVPQTKVAAKYGVNRTTLINWIKKNGLEVV